MPATKKTTIELLSWTGLPVETVYCEWQLSRTDGPVPTPQQVRDKIEEERKDYYMGGHPEIAVTAENEGRLGPGPFESEVRKVFEDCVSMKVPIGETISFVFSIDNMPISLREQWVRHRIGHKYNGDFGFEPIPNIADSSWWSQTFRAKDMGSFATDGAFYEPEWLDLYGDKAMEGHGKVYCQVCGEEAEYKAGNRGFYQCANQHQPFQISPQLTVRHFWREQHLWIQAAYRRMVQAGMPLEDARNVLPVGCQHRMTWSTNLSALTHILSKRGCWIAQLGMWEPVVRGLVNEISTKVDPFFRQLVDPPCIGPDGKFRECRFHKENDEYIKGTDPHHPCPLWLYNHGSRANDVSLTVLAEGKLPTWISQTTPTALAPVMDSDGRFWKPARPHVTGSVEAEKVDFELRANRYAALWGRDPLTGEKQ